MIPSKEKTAVRYLRLLGELSPDNRLTLEPKYATADATGSVEDPRSPIEVVLYGTQDEVLLKHRPPLREDCIFGGRTNNRVINGAVPFPQGVRTLRIFRDGVRIWEESVAAKPPRLSVSWQPASRVSGAKTITWQAEGQQGRELWYYVRYSCDDGRTWVPVGRPTKEPRMEVDFKALPGGKQCRLAVAASDGANTTTAITKRFAVSLCPREVSIFSPADGATFSAREAVNLIGQAWDCEARTRDTAKVEWHSSRDGLIGRQATVVAKLSRGRHVITLRAGSGSQKGEASVTVAIR